MGKVENFKENESGYCVQETVCNAGNFVGKQSIKEIKRRSNQKTLKEISPEYSLEGLMLKLQYFGYLMPRADFIGKDPDAGKDGGQEEMRMTEDEMMGWHH